MSDEVLGYLVRLGRQAEIEAVRLSRVADQRRDEESRRRAGTAWRAFEVRWEAVRVYVDARSGEHFPSPPEAALRPGQGSRRRDLSVISRAGSLASGRLCPGGHAAAAPAACPPSTTARDNEARSG